MSDHQDATPDTAPEPRDAATAAPRPARRRKAPGGAPSSPATAAPTAEGQEERPRPPRQRLAPVATPPPVIPEREPAPDRLVVGRVMGAHGVRGEFRMAIVTNHPEYLRTLRKIYLDRVEEPLAVRRIHPLPGGKEAIVRLAEVTTPEEAAALRGRRVLSERTALPPLPEGEYYHYELIGLDVLDVDGKLLGRLAEIIETGANDVYVVRGPAGEILLPAIDDVIREIDTEGGRMVVRPQEYY